MNFTDRRTGASPRAFLFFSLLSLFMNLALCGAVLADVLCAANEFVSGNACQACPVGASNLEGDDPGGADTLCEYVPPGLQPGDSYQLVFVTSALGEDLNDQSKFITATSNDIAVYNSWANSQAAKNPHLAALNWNALASTDTVEARVNAVVSAPVYRLDGALVASGYADFWDGNIAVPLNVSQYGLVTEGYGGFGLAWTGTKEDGARVDFYTLGNAGSAEASIGYIAFSNASWIHFVYGDPPQDDRSFQSNTFSIYSLSEVQVVPGLIFKSGFEEPSP